MKLPCARPVHVGASSTSVRAQHVRMDGLRQAAPHPAAAALGRASAAALAALLLAFTPLHDSPLLPAQWRGVAEARELASGSGSRVNKDPYSLLRLALPNQPKEMREVQLKLEEAQDSLTRLLPTNANQAVGTAKSILSGKKGAILKAVPAGSASRGEELLAALSSGVDELQQEITNNAGAALSKVDSVLGTVTSLEVGG